MALLYSTGDDGDDADNLWLVLDTLLPGCTTKPMDSSGSPLFCVPSCSQGC